VLHPDLAKHFLGLLDPRPRLRQATPATAHWSGFLQRFGVGDIGGAQPPRHLSLLHSSFRVGSRTMAMLRARLPPFAFLTRFAWACIISPKRRAAMPAASRVLAWFARASETTTLPGPFSLTGCAACSGQGGAVLTVSCYVVAMTPTLSHAAASAK
jgi:hypothetical protein